MEDHPEYDAYFWYGIILVIVLASAANRLQQVFSWWRLRKVAAGKATPSVFSRYISIASQPFRSAITSQIPSISIIHIPSTGVILLIALYIGYLLGLLFYPESNEPSSIGRRAGWLGIAQLPLLIALINKRNVITMLTGFSYEHLNVLHRWVARSLLLMISLHFYFFYQAWGKDPGLLNLDWSDDACVPTGLAAFALLIWINLSTLAPFRNMAYEFFVIQHILCFLAFIACVLIHVPMDEVRAKAYAWVPLALYLLDRFIRLVLFAERSRHGTTTATLEAISYASGGDSGSDGATKITIANPKIEKWKPGSHVLVRLPSISTIQSHPATIASTPASHNGAMVLLLRAHSGFTRKLHAHAKSASSLTTSDPPSTATSSPPHPKAPAPLTKTKILLDGPYAPSIRPLLTTDSILLVAAGSGITFALPHLLVLSEAAAHGTHPLPVRRVKLAWSVRDVRLVRVFLKELASAARRLDNAGIDVAVLLFATGRGGSGSGSVARGGSDAGEQQKQHGSESGPVAAGERLSGLGLTFGSRPTTAARSDEQGAERDEVFDQIENEVVAAFTPAPTKRNVSVTADMFVGGKEGEWRVVTAMNVGEAEKAGGAGAVGGGGGGSGGAGHVEIAKGRMDLAGLVRATVEEEEEGEMGVVVCGPREVGRTVRNVVAKEGVKGRRIWVHVEGQGA